MRLRAHALYLEFRSPYMRQFLNLCPFQNGIVKLTKGMQMTKHFTACISAPFISRAYIPFQ
jgi:hypothetical protein